MSGTGLTSSHDDNHSTLRCLKRPFQHFFFFSCSVGSAGTVLVTLSRECLSVGIADAVVISDSMTLSPSMLKT